MNKCNICGNKVVGNGLCGKHYQEAAARSMGIKKHPTRGLSTLDRLFYYAQPDSSSGCINWTASKFKGGYGKFWMNGKQLPASRASYILHNGQIPDGLFVCHTCDNPSCINPKHLFLGTAKDNYADCISKNRHVAGLKNGRTKLTEDQVIAIRNSTKTQKELTVMFGISSGLVSLIKNRKLWKHIS